MKIDVIESDGLDRSRRSEVRALHVYSKSDIKRIHFSSSIMVQGKRSVRFKNNT
jgi:hypothetical protein